VQKEKQENRPRLQMENAHHRLTFRTRSKRFERGGRRPPVWRCGYENNNIRKERRLRGGTRTAGGENGDVGKEEAYKPF